jgi:hypothetical protein
LNSPQALDLEAIKEDDEEKDVPKVACCEACKI